MKKANRKDNNLNGKKLFLKKIKQDFAKQYHESRYRIWAGVSYANFAKQYSPSSVSKLNSAKNRIQPQMVSLLARMRWYKQGYYEATNLMDPQFQKMIH